MLQRIPFCDRQMVGRGRPRGAGDPVDFWFDGGWWEVEAVHGHTQPNEVVIRDPNRAVRSVPLADLRASVAWEDGSWVRLPPKGQLPALVLSD